MTTTTTTTTTMTSDAVIEQRIIDGLRRLFTDRSAAQVFLNDLIRTYRDSGEATVAEIKETYARQDFLSVSKHAHKLKGLSRNIGANRLGQFCQRLEAQAKQAPPAVIGELCAQVAAEFDLSCAELRDRHMLAG